MLDGIRYLRSNRAARDLIVMTAAFTVFAVGLQAVLPNIVVDRLGLGPQGFGILYGFYGVGALFGAVTRGVVATRCRGRLVAVSMILYGLATVAVVLLAVPVAAAAMLIVAGMAWVWTLTTLNAAVQVQTPAWVRGRVIAIFVLAIGMKPIGAALVGLAAETIGLTTGVAISGLGSVLVGLWALRMRVVDTARVSTVTTVV
jgi:predicted MFS family arabinose efflux permease